MGNNQTIKLSVIISTSSGPAALQSSLNSLVHNSRQASEIEVILVTDGEIETLQENLVNISFRKDLKVLRQHGSGHAAAWNCGAKSASGIYLLFLTDHIQPSLGMAAAHLRMQEKYGGVIGLGNTEWTLTQGRNGFVKYVMEKRNRETCELKEASQLSNFNHLIGNLSIPRKSFLDAAGFAVDILNYEIPELCYRLERKGLPFVFISDAVGKSNIEMDLFRIVDEIREEGKTSVEIYRRHPALLPRLALGSFNSDWNRWVLLRRILLAFRFPSLSLIAIGFLLGSRQLANIWYGFVYTYCYWSGVRKVIARDTWQRLTNSPVILLYHAVGTPGEHPTRYILPAGRFAQQMAWLRFWRYKILSLEQFLDDRRSHRLSPSHSVIITFDDGYEDNYLQAYPVLKKHGFPATIFQVSRAIGDTNQWDTGSDLTGRPILTLAQIREMQSGCISFGAHTRNHPKLTDLSAEQLLDEIEGSRSDLEQQLNRPVPSFAFPYGSYNQDSQKTVERAGFLGACTVESGFNDPHVPSHALRRATIEGTDSLLHFILAIWFGNTRVLSDLFRKPQQDLTPIFHGKSSEYHSSNSNS